MIRGTMTCHHCGSGALTKRLVVAIKELEAILPPCHDIIVTSGYRCAVWNAECGGSPISRHMTGEAIDFVITDMDIQDMLRVTKEIEYFRLGGIGVYTGKKQWVHADVRQEKARWWYENGAKKDVRQF